MIRGRSIELGIWSFNLSSLFEKCLCMIFQRADPTVFCLGIAQWNGLLSHYWGSLKVVSKEKFSETIHISTEVYLFLFLVVHILYECCYYWTCVFSSRFLSFKMNWLQCHIIYTHLDPLWSGLLEKICQYWLWQTVPFCSFCQLCER